MKKNKMLRMASALLVLTLLTTSIIGGTFAKYTTASTGKDTARVAKWGVTLDVKSDLFADAYADIKVAYDVNNATVKATAQNTDVVAPGTKGTGLEVTNAATREPEVSYSMKIKLDKDTAKMPSLNYTPKNATVASTYEPVKFYVYNGGDKLNGGNALSLAELKVLFDGTKIIYQYDVASGQYTVDSDLDGVFTDETATNVEPNIKVEWVWAYEDAMNKALYDELDTILGDTAVGVSPAITKYSGGEENSISDININVKLDWIVTATQID